MKVFARLLAKELARRIQRNDTARNLFILAPLIPLILIVGMVMMISLLVFVMVSSQNGGGCGTSVPISSPGLNVRTAAETVSYFESQGISANGAAGIVGNLQQESGLNPTTPGGGLAQWLGNRWTALVTYDSSHSLDPNSMAGQLTFIVYDLRTTYAGLLTELNSAPDPGTAATMFETVYEVCSGVTGYLQVTPGSPCNDTARRTYASQALSASGGASVAVSATLVTGGTCIGVGGPGGDPIPGFTPKRDDRGTDACAQPGMPIYAPADSVLVDIVPSWYKGQPLLLFKFNPPLAGTYQNDQYWFLAEQIVPVSIIIGTQFAAGQPVATFASSGTCIEIGWGSPTTPSRGLVQADANPPSGALTPEAEAFKVFFHIPWVGVSPA